MQNKYGIDSWKNCDSASHKHCVKSWKNLARLWKAQKLCDIVIVVQGCEFRCHEIVPASASPFFRNALLKRSEMSANDSAVCRKEIIVDFMAHDIFAQVLNFMYTSEIEIKPDKVRPLILAGGRLQLQGLVSAVLGSILRWELNHNETDIQKIKQNNRKYGNANLPKVKKFYQNACEEENCCEVVDSQQATDKYSAWHSPFQSPEDAKLTVTGLLDEIRLQGDMNVHAFALKFAARNYGDIMKTKAFLSCSVHTLGGLLADDRLDIGEFEVFKSLCKWLEANKLHEVHAPYLLSKVRLHLLTLDELAEHVETKEYLMKKKKCRVIILEAFRHHCLASQALALNKKCPSTQKRRRGTCREYDSDDEPELVKENLQEKKKEKSFSVLKPCDCCPDYILASGGIDTKTKTASDGVYKYEERENSWLRFTRMPQLKNHHGSVYCRGSLFILGGSDPSMTGPGAEVCPVSSCHRLGLGALKWSKIQSMTTPRMSFNAIYLDNYIYAIGGQDHKQRILRDVERYSLQCHKWEHTGSLTSARAGMACCTHRGQIWIIGGYDHKNGVVSDLVEAYESEFGKWKCMPPLRFPRCFASAASCGNKIFVIGGAWLDTELECSKFSSVYDIDVYNELSRCWEGISALRVGRHDAGLAVLGSRLYIIGGKHCDEGSIGNLGSVECYDTHKNCWIDGIEALPIPLLGSAITYTS